MFRGQSGPYIRGKKIIPKDHEGFSGGSDSKEFACNVGDLGSVPGLVRFPGEGNSYPLQDSGLENSMDRGDWQVSYMGSQRVITHDHKTKQPSLKDQKFILCNVISKAKGRGTQITF